MDIGRDLITGRVFENYKDSKKEVKSNGTSTSAFLFYIIANQYSHHENALLSKSPPCWPRLSPMVKSQVLRSLPRLHHVRRLNSFPPNLFLTTTSDTNMLSRITAAANNPDLRLSVWAAVSVVYNQVMCKLFRVVAIGRLVLGKTARCRERRVGYEFPARPCRSIGCYWLVLGLSVCNAFVPFTDCTIKDDVLVSWENFWQTRSMLDAMAIDIWSRTHVEILVYNKTPHSCLSSSTQQSLVPEAATGPLTLFPQRGLEMHSGGPIWEPGLFGVYWNLSLDLVSRWIWTIWSL